MDPERAIEFILNSQANAEVQMQMIREAQARGDVQMEKIREAQAHGEVETEKIRIVLRRATRYAVQEARNERRKRREVDSRVNRVNEEMEQIRATQRVTGEQLQLLISSLRRGENGNH